MSNYSELKSPNAFNLSLKSTELFIAEAISPNISLDKISRINIPKSNKKTNLKGWVVKVIVRTMYDKE